MLVVVGMVKEALVKVLIQQIVICLSKKDSRQRGYKAHEGLLIFIIDWMEAWASGGVGGG